MSTERNYSIARNGQKHGPYSLDELQYYLNKGELLLNDLCWLKGTPEWLPLVDVEGLDVSEVKMPPPPRRTAPLVSSEHILPLPDEQIEKQPKSETTPWVAVFAAIVFPVIGLIFWIAYMATGHEEKAKSVGWATLLSTIVFGLFFLMSLSA